MTTAQLSVLRFWKSEKRPSAIFECRDIGPADIEADAAMAQRYWQRQLRACQRNVEIAKAGEVRGRVTATREPHKLDNRVQLPAPLPSKGV